MAGAGRRVSMADGAQVLDQSRALGRVFLGRRAVLQDDALVIGDASINNAVIGRGMIIHGDALINAPRDVFTDTDPVAPHMWTVYRTKRGVWQACAGCVRGIDMIPGIDFTDESVYVDGAHWAPYRDAQLARVLEEIERREAS